MISPTHLSAVSRWSHIQDAEGVVSVPEEAKGHMTPARVGGSPGGQPLRTTGRKVCIHILSVCGLVQA